MKDLFVMTADSDAQALMKAVLRRPRTLGIRPISFEVQRLTGRDPGMVKEGPELVRAMVRKTDYARMLLVWDHEGSGWHSDPPDGAVTRIQERLDGVTWSDRSAAIVIVPELEEWLWHCPKGMARCLGLDIDAVERDVSLEATKLKLTPERCRREKPKELFEAVFYRSKRHKPLLKDFDALGSYANLKDWRKSSTFSRFVDTLKAWFPAA
jgi:hypothetical protein